MSDNTESILDKVLGAVWSARKEDTPDRTDVTVSEDNSAAVFETRINAILKTHKDDMKDLVYVIDLAKIRDRLGSQWNQSLGKIHQKADTIIKSQLRAADIYIRRDDVTYVLIFDALPRLQGHLKAIKINEEIAQALVGVKDAGTLTSVKDVTIDKNGEVVVTDAPGKDQLIAEIIEKADQEREPDKTLGVRKSLLHLSELRFVYRPMLVTRTRVVSTYVCIPVSQEGEDHFASGYNVFGSTPSPQEIFELDCLTQHVAAEELGKLIKIHGRSLIALPVHFETLANVQRRMNYLADIENIIDRNRNRIVFEMVGLPENIPQPRILELSAVLRNHSRAIIARFSPEHGNFPAYRAAGLHAVGIDVFSMGKTENMMVKDMEKFVKNAKQNELKTYIHGIRSISLLTAAISIGFDYLDGYALGSVVDQAQDIRGFSMADAYLEYQKRQRN